MHFLSFYIETMNQGTTLDLFLSLDLVLPASFCFLDTGHCKKARSICADYDMNVSPMFHPLCLSVSLYVCLSICLSVCVCVCVCCPPFVLLWSRYTFSYSRCRLVERKKKRRRRKSNTHEPDIQTAIDQSGGWLVVIDALRSLETSHDVLVFMTVV